MLTITAVTISGGTRTLSSVTKVPPTVCRVLVSQFGVPSATGPISRATSPRATPSTRARRTCAANGTRRRRASTRRGPFGFGRGRRGTPASTAGGRHPSEVQGTPSREAPQVLHVRVNADARGANPACEQVHPTRSWGREPPSRRAAGEFVATEGERPFRRHGVGAVDLRILELRRHPGVVLGVHRTDEGSDAPGVGDAVRRPLDHHRVARVVRGQR